MDIAPDDIHADLTSHGKVRSHGGASLIRGDLGGGGGDAGGGWGLGAGGGGGGMMRLVGVAVLVLMVVGLVVGLVVGVVGGYRYHAWS